MNNKVVALIAIAVVIVVGWLVYRHNGSSVNLDSGLTLPYGSTDNGSPAASAPADNTPVSTTPAAGTVKEFTVNGGGYYFAPKTITVNKGDTVKINFVNAGGMHDWVLDAFNAKTPVIQSGQTASVTFVADKTGTFEYYCSVGNHRQMGMVGTLTVN
ncbi:cupredoxin domain-containing protein [Candidatus Parcubacteria bacterium]|nr:cupredoxin domain-containing protein [Candidatus Parcubacteria bacterium]